MIHNLTGKDPKSYSSVFLDFDGTILESGEGVINAVKYMFSRMDMQENDEKRIIAFIGPPVLHHLAKAYDMHGEEAARAYAFFREYYLSKGAYESQLYDGILDALRQIRKSGKTIYIATCKGEVMVKEMIKRLDLLSYFDDIFGAWHDKGVYDKAQVLGYALERLGGLDGRAIMVGDRNHDIEGGKAVGLDTAGVLYGYGSRDELLCAGSDYLLDSISDLSDMLGGNGQ